MGFSRTCSFALTENEFIIFTLIRSSRSVSFWGRWNSTSCIIVRDRSSFLWEILSGCCDLTNWSSILVGLWAILCGSGLTGMCGLCKAAWCWEGRLTFKGALVTAAKETSVTTWDEGGFIGGFIGGGGFIKSGGFATGGDFAEDGGFVEGGVCCTCCRDSDVAAKET